MKKIISIALLIVVLLGTLAVNVNAATTDSVNEIYTIGSKYGMTEKFGPVFLEATEEDYMLQRKYYSEQTGKEVDDEIRKIITEQYSRAKNILLENREKLEEVTTILLEKETIMGPEFEAIMRGENI